MADHGSVETVREAASVDCVVAVAVAAAAVVVVAVVVVVVFVVG